MKNIPRFTRVFWFSYIFCMIWALAVIVVFVLFSPNNPNFEDMGTFEAALSVKLSLRRILAVVVGAMVITALLFTNSRFFDKAMIFISAWMWAAYIDDYLVMYPYVYVPEEFVAQFVLQLRPLIMMLVSWMAIESHLRREAGR